MAIFGFALGALLFVCGLGSLVVALNLVPTDMGLLYGVSGVILIGCGSIVLAIAALTARLGRLLLRPVGWPAPEPALANDEVEPAATATPFEPPPAQEEETAEEAPSRQVVGRYSSSSGKYMVFSDGAVEAETPEGVFHFSSLTEFKTYVASRSA